MITGVEFYDKLMLTIDQVQDTAGHAVPFIAVVANVPDWDLEEVLYITHLPLELEVEDDADSEEVAVAMALFAKREARLRGVLVG